ncbi:MAG: hypothetical protein ACOC4F_03815 [bacterium]
MNAVKNTRVADSIALLIRACAAGCTAWAGYSLRFLAGGSAPARLLFRNRGFAGACIRAQIATLRPPGRKLATERTNRPVFGLQKPVRTVVDRTLLRLSRDSVGRLEDARVRRLQARIMNLVLARDCGIRLDHDQLDGLARINSVAWVRDNLLAAAGLPLARVEQKHQSRGQHPATARCRVVLPAFLHTLRVYLGWTDAAAAGAPVPRLPTTAAPLFPQDIARRERAVLRSFGELEVASRYRRARLRQPEAELEIFLSAISLLQQATTVPEGTAQRLLRRITSYHERRTLWTHGPAAHTAPQATTTPLSATAPRI